MFSSRNSIWRFAMASVLFSNLASSQITFTQKYCSTLNTADTSRNESDWQSNGLCHDFCLQDYAFAVVQDKGCWCSNFVPATTTTGCTQECPGYPFELCGGIGLYGYVELPLKPSGTKGAIRSTSTATTQQQQSSTTEQPTTIPTSNPPRASSSWVPTPIISLETITGQVRTVTVTPTTRPADRDQQNSNLLPTTQSKGGLSTGGAVGLTIGLVALAAIVGLVAWFCLKKRRKQKEVEYVETSRESMSAAGGPIPSRSMSENSRYVLGAEGRQGVERWESDESAKRKSRIVPVDQRLDPFSPVYTHNMNKSHESVNTIRDDHDYSRRVVSKPVLRTTNPD